MAKSLSDALASRATSPAPEQSTAAPTEAPAATETQATEAKPAEDTGEKAAPPTAKQETQEAKPTATTADDAEDGPPVPRKALLDERRKRQDLEHALAELKGQISVYQSTVQRPAMPPPPPPEPADKRFYGDPITYIKEEVGRAAKEMRDWVINRSEYEARKQYSDYDAKLEGFAKAAKQDQSLWAKLNAHPAPAFYAYEIGQNYLMLEDGGGSLEAMAKKIRDQTRVEVESELRKKFSLDSANDANRSLVNAPGSGATTEAKRHGPISLSEVFAARRKHA